MSFHRCRSHPFLNIPSKTRFFFEKLYKGSYTAKYLVSYNTKGYI